jgi:hypothetical protein
MIGCPSFFNLYLSAGVLSAAMNMEPMSFWHLILNNPEWVGVFANALFAIVTIGVVIWQVCVMRAQVRVMKWQGRNSARHELIQNRLIRLQHEHEWVLRKNQQREQLLKLGRKLNLAADSLKETPSEGDRTSWGEVQDTLYELQNHWSYTPLYHSASLRGCCVASCN